MSTPYQQSANTPVERLRATFQRAVDGIRNRQDLTPQAREIAIARAYRTARDGLAATRQTDIEHYQRQRGLLERRLFGSTDATGADAGARRVAREMAAKHTDPQEAAAAFQRAVRDGDTDYAKAIAAHAADLATQPIVGAAWQGVVAEYVKGDDRRATAYKELSELSDPSSGLDFTYQVSKPRELGRYYEHQVDQVANSDLEVHGGPEAA